MKALWLEDCSIDLREVPPPQRSGEALIRIRRAGICGTDLELVRGYYPFAGIPGHEFVGDVIEAPDRVLVGKRVVGEINAVCGRCEQCLSGRSHHCESRTVLGIAGRDGVFAEFTTLPLENLHVVPDDVPDEAAVFTEPLAAALEIQEQVQIHPADRVLLIGAGRLGQLIAQTLALTGCGLQVVARHPQQKKLLAERGIKLTSEEEMAPRRWDVVVEATGSPAGFELARKAVRPCGTLVLKSTYKGEMTVDFSSIVVDEIALVGSRCGPFDAALRLLAGKDVDPTILIAAEYGLGDVVEAFAEAGKTGRLKVLVRP
jgi:threonine dehydrogenase-like Zn-dependent dehydrogenase